MNELLYKEEAYSIIGKCMEIHAALGHGFLEAVYKDALEYEFRLSGIPFVREQRFDIKYKDTILNKKYIADFTVYERIILEVKAIDVLSNAQLSQALNYLKASKLRLCILANFGSHSCEFKRGVS
jgi:GxxExxY protein